MPQAVFTRLELGNYYDEASGMDAVTTQQAVFTRLEGRAEN